MMATSAAVLTLLFIISIMGWITGLDLGWALFLCMLVSILVSVLVSSYLRSIVTAENSPTPASNLEPTALQPDVRGKSVNRSN